MFPAGHSAGRRQRGAALLVLAVILVLGASAFLIKAVNEALDRASNDRVRNAEVLQHAKAALLGYVAKEVLDLSESVPGRFPCPESPSDAGGPNEGRAGSACDPTYPTNKTLGRLPWRTLGIDKLVDSAGEPLWYAVSPNWVLGGAIPVINGGTAGQLTVDGLGDAVAVIFAPGRAFKVDPNASQAAVGCGARSQVRNDRSHNASFATNPDYRDYLECQNASTPIDANFGVAIVDNATNPVLNDQVAYITAREVLNAIQGPLAERVQRTVAPLLSEYGDRWISGRKFLPYAFPFTSPESAAPSGTHCGPAAASQVTEGLLPIAPSAGGCSSNWASFSISGSGIGSNGCAPDALTNTVTCRFDYYTLTFLGNLLKALGLLTSSSVTATIQAIAPHAAASFRDPFANSDVAVSPTPPASLQSLTLVPQTDGDARLSMDVRVQGAELCADNLVAGLVCFLLGPLFVDDWEVSVRFPQLANPVLQGTMLPATVAPTPPYAFDLLSPAATDPHYWFFRNEWYRYIYYAVAPSASASGPGGGDLRVSGFPAEYGAADDKSFVLVLMGPATTGQNRGVGATLDQYVEGENLATGASPRRFAYRVFSVSGNDRIATCPFAAGLPNDCN